MDLEAEISIPTIPQQAYLHDNSGKLKLINGTPVSAVEEAAAAVVAASRAGGGVFTEAQAPGQVQLQAPLPVPASAPPAPPPPLVATGAGAATPGSNGSTKEEAGSKKPVRYRECQKNHAAGIGGHALDGCGEFMPTGEEGSIDALKCSACDCHRNFHRREVEGEVFPPPQAEWYKTPGGKDSSRKKQAPGSAPPALLQSPLAAITPGSGVGRSSSGGLMALSGSDQSDEQDAAAAAIAASAGHNSAFALAHHLIPSAIRKRYRTKFSSEQKEKMFMFAERLGWKIQKHDEAEVQQFCADVGVKRHVLKVWMHNNKNTFSKKLS